VWVSEFSDYDREQPTDLSHADSLAITKYKENRNAIKGWMQDNAPRVEMVQCCLDLPAPFETLLGAPTPFRAPLVVDISCAPRGRLLALLRYLAKCQEHSGQRVSLMYSLVKRQAPSEEAFSYGMQDVRVVPGFAGQVRLKKDLLIIVLGFEGNRAFSLHRRLMPNKTILILGDSGDSERDFFLRQARANNHALLNTHGKEIHVMASRDPIRFAQEFEEVLKTRIEPVIDKFNIYVCCLGTKLQAVGAYLALRKYPYVQVVDALPSRRRIASEGERQTLFMDLGVRALLEDIPTSLKIA
jgi:hypothetical protein